MGRYDRVIDPDAGDSLAMLVKWIRPGAAVLDVGAATGALGQYLSHQRDCIVDGVERDIGAAALARRHYRRMVAADLDHSDLATLFPPRAYDYVVCADVLEHLQRPERVLASARSLLREGGSLLISIPNAAYAPFLAELLGGQLQYRPVGLLDETHLRFVTRASLEQMLVAAGFATAALERVVKPPHESEFGAGYLEALPPAVRLFLEQSQEAYTYQFVVHAVLREEQHPDGMAAGGEQPFALPLRFVARLYWRTEDSPYAADRQVQALGEIGAGPQTLRFALPQKAGRVAGLLLELSDRETILELRGLRVYGSEGLVWSWSGLAEDLRRAAHERMTFVEREAPGTGVQAVVWAREPRLELPVGREELARCEGGCTVEAEVGWPLSPEYRQVLDHLRGRFAELTTVQEQVKDLTAERDRLGVLLEDRLRLLQETERAREEAVQERDRALGLLEERLALLQETERAWEEAVQERDRALGLLEERLVLLQTVSRQAQELEAEREQLRQRVEEKEVIEEPAGRDSP